MTPADPSRSPYGGLAGIQQAVDRWISATDAGYFPELTNMALLAEEVGEVARIMARRFGSQRPKPGDDEGNLADELADVVWVVAAIANQTGIDLSEAFCRNLEKKTKRDASRFSNKTTKTNEND